jgi:hypothetical protein
VTLIGKESRRISPNEKYLGKHFGLRLGIYFFNNDLKTTFFIKSFN